MADIAKLITQLDEALRDESTASDLRRVARILIGDPVVQTTIAPPYASTSRVERLAEDLAELRDQVAVLTDMAHGRIRPVDMPDLNGLAVGVNTLHKVVDDFGRRLEKLEYVVDWLNGANMENGHAANDPEPLVDTSWHPFNFSVDLRPDDGKRVVVMTRSGLVDGPFTAEHAHWDERGVMTIVAWRYAKEEE